MFPCRFETPPSVSWRGLALLSLLLPFLLAFKGPANPGPSGQPKGPAVSLLASSRYVRVSATGVPTHFVLWPTAKIKRAAFFSTFAASFHLGANDKLKEEVSFPRVRGGRSYTRYVQVSSGVPVELSSYVLTESNGYVESGGGFVAPPITASATPTIAEPVAFSAALTAVNAKLYRWLDPATPGPRPPGTLSFYSPDFGATKPFRLVYRYAISTSNPSWTSYLVHVDALTGAVIDKLPGTRPTDAPNSGITADGKVVPFTADRYLGMNGAWLYRLRETSARSITTLFAAPRSPAVDFVNAGSYWQATVNRRGVSAHWAAERTWDYFEKTFNWTGSDGRGTSPQATPVSVVERLGEVGVSCWVAPDAIYLRNYSSASGPPSTDLETVAHELGHAREYYALGGSDFDEVFAPAIGPESGIISESWADIIATSVQAFVTNQTSDWLLFDGDSTLRAEYRRNMANPKLSHQPDTYGGALWSLDSGPHTLNGVPNHWFYLLAVGGTGTNDKGYHFSVLGVGRRKAELIAIPALYTLTPTSDLATAREKTVDQARYQFGEGSPELVATAAAWDAVGVKDPADPDNVPFSSPKAGAIDVNPWNASLTFETPASSCKGAPRCLESIWRVQVSSSPDFDADVQTSTVSEAKGMGTTKIARANFVLHAGTVYHWRAMALNAGAGGRSTWAFTRSFSTARQQPRNVSPAFRDVDVHPWPVTFTWGEVAGANGYQIQVSETPDFTKTLFSSDVPGSKAHSFKAKVLHAYYWRVRARGPSGGGFSSWSTMFHSPGVQLDSPTDVDLPWSPELTLRFGTSDPIPVQEAPRGDVIDPWTAQLVWTNNGATAYELRLSRVGGATTVTPFVAGASSHPHARADEVLDVSAHYAWSVRAKGYFDDWTSWSKPVTFDTSNAASKALTPAPGEYAYPWPVRLDWTPVPAAHSYLVEVARNGDSTFASPAASVKVTAKIDVPNMGPQVVTAATVNVAPLLNNHFHWRVLAVGPNGAPGAWSNADAPELQYFKTNEDSMPKSVSPTGVRPTPTTGISFQWTPVLNATHYAFTIQDGQTGQTVGTFAAEGDATTATFPGPLSEDHFYHWTLQAIGPDDIPGEVSTDTSGGFKTVKKQAIPPQAPLALSCYGAIGYLFTIFSTVPDAIKYEILITQWSEYYQDYVVVRDDTYSNDELEASTESVLKALNGYSFPPSGFLIGAFPNAAPLQTYWWYVRACSESQCGAWSNAAEWTEGLPWPF